jgi:hypothetical protein
VVAAAQQHAVQDLPDEVLMFLLVRIYVLFPESPGVTTRRADIVATVAPAFCALDKLLHLAIAAVHLAALAEHAHAVLVFKLHREVVKDMAVDFPNPGLAAPQRGRFHWMPANNPVHDVEIVNVLLDNMVSPQPGEIIPIAELPLHIGPVRLPFDHPNLPTIPVGAGVDDFTDGSVLDALDRLVVFAFVASLGSGYKAKVLLPGEFPRFERIGAGCVTLIPVDDRNGNLAIPDEAPTLWM